MPTRDEALIADPAAAWDTAAPACNRTFGEWGAILVVGLRPVS